MKFVSLLGAGLIAASVWAGAAGAAQFPGPYDSTIWDLAKAKPAGSHVGMVGAVGEESAAFRVFKFRPDGSRYKAFGGRGFAAPFEKGMNPAQGEGVAIGRDGSIVAVGYRLPEQDQALANYRAALIAKLRPSGSLQRRFGHGGVVKTKLRSRGGEIYRDVDIDGKGRIVVVGSVNEALWHDRAALVRMYSSRGELVRGFGKGGTVRVARDGHSGRSDFDEVEVLPSGKILVSGFLSGRPVVVRLTAAGKLDHGFGRRGIVASKANPDLPCNLTCRSRTALDVNANGRITLVSAPWNRNLVIERFAPSGARIKSFGRRGVATVSPARLVPAARSVPGYRRIASVALGGAAVTKSGAITIAGTVAIEAKGSDDRRSSVLIALNRRGDLARSFGKRGALIDTKHLSTAATSILAQGERGVLVGGAIHKVDPETGPDLVTLRRFRR
ncbi:MAG: hypothetical protein J0H98_00750 [Solirubrobacterales bacterium]|nr:hypothetical protein [Solirubrobacterales bacterium]